MYSEGLVCAQHRGPQGPLLRRFDAHMNMTCDMHMSHVCTNEYAMRTPPARLILGAEVASTGDTQTDRSNRR